MRDQMGNTVCVTMHRPMQENMLDCRHANMLKLCLLFVMPRGICNVQTLEICAPEMARALFSGEHLLSQTSMVSYTRETVHTRHVLRVLHSGPVKCTC